MNYKILCVEDKFMSDLTNYQKGILWSISSINGDGRIVVRHTEKHFLSALERDNTIYEQQIQNGKTQYVLKFVDKEVLSSLINDGYTARNSDVRSIPQDADKQFLQAYIEIHGSCDWQLVYRRNGDKYYKARLRLYGNKTLIEQLNYLMKKFCDVSLKTPQRITDKSYYLSYASQSEIEKICSEFETEPIRYEDFWDKMRVMINEYNINR